jgi:hypothetical protein
MEPIEPPLKDYNLYIEDSAGLLRRIWSGDEFPVYPLIDTVHRAAYWAGAAWSFTNRDGRHISY